MKGKTRKKLPTAAELIAAAKEGRLMDVMLPTGQKLGDHLVPGDAGITLDTITPLGKRFGDHTGDEVAEVAQFYESMASAMEIYRRPRLVPGGKA